jgi:hypothetical protein
MPLKLDPLATRVPSIDAHRCTDCEDRALSCISEMSEVLVDYVCLLLAA